MRFRQQQDDARRATQRLLALFAALLLALLLAVNGLLIGLWWAVASWLFDEWPPLFIETNTALVLLFVLGGAWVELGRLRAGGGAHVAE
ncbi:MAG TPA: peptidase M48, partial [Rhizobacter sp.]|nr:peptidase M48 [Rhizobacter sp.]